MRLFPRSPWRIAILLLLSLAFVPLHWWRWQARATWLFVTDARVHDEADVIAAVDEWRFERYLAWINDESGADVHFILTSDLSAESIERFAVREAREREIGQDVDRRGLLIVYDAAGHRLRVEVGAGLEGMITDAFSGYLAREHVRSFFGAGDPTVGLRTTLMIVQHRLREGALGMEYDPAADAHIEDLRRLAVGGGASAVVQLASRDQAFLNQQRTSPREVRLHFAPQPTPQEAYRRYLEWLARGRYETDVPLFTPLSQEYLAGLTMTAGFNDFMLQSELGQSSDFLVRNELAVQYFTSTPLVSPHFYRRTPAGWTVDMVAEVLDTRNYVGGRWNWGLLDTGDEFSVEFADQWVGAGPVLRFTGGDNRPIPARGAPVRAALGPLPRSVTVDAAAEEIVAARSPVLVVLYATWIVDEDAHLPEVVELAARCGAAGAEIRAYTVDHYETPLRQLRDSLAALKSPFEPVRLLPWRTGELDRTMSTLGIRVGATWGVPLVAVRSGGRVTIQSQSRSGLLQQRDAIADACAGSPPSF